jgi:hypothetical protein
MTHGQAISKSYELYEEWVSFDKQVDLNRVHASMLQEYRWTLKNPGRMTAACFSELKGKLILLGKVRKALAR